MARKPSLGTTLPLRMAYVASAAILLMGLFWVYAEYREFRHEAAEIRRGYMEQQRDALKQVVRSATAYVDYMRRQTDTRMRKTLRDRVEEAHAIAARLHDQFHRVVSRNVLEGMVREALRPIRFNEGRGYFFAFDRDGIEQLFADRPEMEGKNMLGVRGSKGEPVVPDMLDIVAREGEGFYAYTWTKPGDEGRHFDKVAYVKLLEPLGWIIGTGEYTADVEQDIKREVLERLGEIRFGEDDYVFAGQWDGLSLTGPATGRNMWDVTDVNGVRIVQELVARAKEGGGLVEYVIPKFGKGRSARKLSYVEGVEDWNWYVGAGRFVDDIERTIAQRRKDLARTILFDMVWVGLLVVAVLVLTNLAARGVGRTARRNHDAFMAFFGRAAGEAVSIDPDRMDFVEFEEMATAANRMSEARRKAEYDLHLTRFAVDHSADVICWIEPQGTIVEVNEAGARLLGHPRDILKGMSVLDIDPDLTPEGWAKSWAKLEERGTRTTEVTLSAADGRRVPMELVSNYLAFEGREYACVVARDITERRATERNLAERTADLERSNTELEQFAYVASHDLQEPLRMVVSYIQLLEKRYHDRFDDDARTYIGYAVEGAKRMSTLIRDLLEFSQVRRETTAFAPCPLENAVETAMTNLQIAIVDAGAVVEVGLLPTIEGDPKQLVSLFQNLIGNAVKYRHPDRAPEIRVAAVERDGGWAVSVEDNGIGIEEQYLGRIFTIFQRLHKRQDYAGTGIGLAICKKIAEHHGGRIRVDSEPGMGSTFEVFFPDQADD